MKRTFLYSLAAIVVAGCSYAGGPAVSGPSEALPSNGGSIDASLRGKTLLYASSIDQCVVYVFTYPHGKLVQSFDACAFGLGPGYGLCTDRHGDVFMAMGQGFSILEFAHGGTQPIAQLDNGSHQPFGCSVDPKSGDLAVAGGKGNVTVFAKASGTPQVYSLSGIYAFYYCTFDDRGNLFAAGQHYGGTFALAELPKGGSALREITLSGYAAAGFTIQWDGRNVAVGVTQGSDEFVIDRIRVRGSKAKIVGSTTLHAAPNTLVPFQFWIDGGTVIRPENANSEVGFWNYPAGGERTKEIQPGGESIIGVTVSASPRR